MPFYAFNEVAAEINDQFHSNYAFKGVKIPLPVCQ